jgi:capsular polysaccharide biosynthesis protein
MEVDIQRLFYAILRKWWLILILALLGGSIATYLVKKTVPMYLANSTLYLMNRDKVLMTGQSLDTNDLNLSRQIGQDYSEIIQSRMVTTEVLRRLKNSNLNDNVLNSIVSVSFQTNSNILVISTVYTDPRTAADVNNTICQVFVDKVNALTNSNNVGILDQAQIPQYPVSNSSTIKLLVGIIAGIAIGFVIIFMKEMFDTTIRSVEDIEHGLELEVIGIIPEHAIK